MGALDEGPTVAHVHVQRLALGDAEPAARSLDDGVVDLDDVEADAGSGGPHDADDAAASEADHQGAGGIGGDQDAGCEVADVFVDDLAGLRGDDAALDVLGSIEGEAALRAVLDDEDLAESRGLAEQDGVRR
ncbi:MAG TPA: hypothetical protein PLI95_16030 [Polyangiaceae bacterium]|nr:hypothetical protein [Polyangiaceae bacterium]